MTRDTEAVDEIVFECDFDEPPEKVWRALTERELRDAWMLGDDRQSAPRDERRSTELQVLEAEPNRFLRLACRDRKDGPAPDHSESQVVESTVTFELSPSQAGGTHMRLVHSEFRFASDAQRHNTVCSLAAARARRTKKTEIVSCLASPHTWLKAA
jgi:uncharacterized protein YndB with AHSA1/START domain